MVRLRGAAGPKELVVGTEPGGELRVVMREHADLSARARAQLAFHEVASGRVIEIAADELFVFDIQVLEMLPDAPGPNDALYLYGSIRGPYPTVGDQPVRTVDGQLTVTRADLIRGLVDGVLDAFACTPEPRGSRCVHALLPGERAQRLEAGHGAVLGFPLAPAWTLDALVSNDLVAAQLLYDVLIALRADLGIKIDPPLPVPSRQLYEHTLVSAGWRIDGDEAVRPKKGIIGSVFGSAERQRLPRECSLDELVAIATQLLAQVPGVPSAEITALKRGRVQSPPQPAPPAPPAPPANTLAPASPPPSAAPRPRVGTSPSDWMKDFVDAHRTTERPKPTVTAPARAVAPDATPAWMEDFGDAPRAESEPTDEPAHSPDWSKDFD